MANSETHDRRYLQYRLHEELDRGKRYGREFSLLVFEMVPSSDALPPRRKMRLALQAIAATVRPSDVIAEAYEDTVAVLLVETGARGAKDALMRIRNRIVGSAGTWQVSLYYFPQQGEMIAALPLLTAA